MELLDNFLTGIQGGRIEIDPDWVKQNIVTITLPGLNTQVEVHKDAAENFIMAFNLIKNGTAVINGKEVPLLSLIKTMDGTFVPRHVYWNPNRVLATTPGEQPLILMPRDTLDM